MATITADLVDGLRVTITDGTHTWTADEPRDLGGSDQGPDPYEYLLGSLAACTAITLSMFAQRKGLALDSVSTTYHYEKVHADDCAHCEDDLSGWLDHVTSEIFIEGDFSEAEADRLREVAVRCPVHKTLANGMTFTEKVIID